MIDNALDQFIRGIPKAELHTHLDSVPPELLLRIAQRNNVELPFADVVGAYEWYQFSDLEEFLGKWKLTTDVLLTETDYYETALELGKDMQHQNIIRREVMFTYAAAHEGRVELDTIMKGLARGRNQVKEELKLDLYYIADIDRTISPERSLKYVNDIAAYKDEAGILGIGLDCQEVGYPAGIHQEAFKRARKLGFNLSAHAGEEYAAGPAGVWDVVNHLKVDRIDHGNQAIRDETLISHVIEHNIPMMLCPISNISINIYNSISEHPIIELRDKGVTVTVNSDDPPFFRADLIDNYIQLVEAFNLGFDDIVQFVRNSFTCSYASSKEKTAYLAHLDNWLKDNTIPSDND